MPSIAIRPESGTKVSGRPANELKIAAVTPFTTIDFPGCLSAVAFLQGCPWRCPYCHNPWMQPREFAPGAEQTTWESFYALLKHRRGLLDGVVFSGGEPCLDPALSEAVRAVRALGMRVGLHTSGAYPTHLKAIVGELDWVGLDVKADPEDEAGFARAAGRPFAREAFLASFELIRASGLAYEARTTVHPVLHSPESILAIGRWLKARGATHYAVQVFRKAPGVSSDLAAVGADYPGETVLEGLKALFGAGFVLRRE